MLDVQVDAATHRCAKNLMETSPFLKARMGHPPNSIGRFSCTSTKNSSTASGRGEPSPIWLSPVARQFLRRQWASFLSSRRCALAIAIENRPRPGSRRSLILDSKLMQIWFVWFEFFCSPKASWNIPFMERLDPS